jgi:hypothetical protein
VLWALLLVLLTVAAYVSALHGGFVWDDDDYVTENTHLRVSRVPQWAAHRAATLTARRGEMTWSGNL